MEENDKSKRIVVGSRAFFSGCEDFNPHDNDILFLEDNPKDYNVQQQIRLKGNCYFKWKRMTPDEYIRYHEKCNCGMFLGKFLVPEFAEEIGMTIEDLKRLQSLVDKLDEKHAYEKVIFDSYVENNGFFLTKEQRNKAYAFYKKYHLEENKQ